MIVFIADKENIYLHIVTDTTKEERLFSSSFSYFVSRHIFDVPQLSAILFQKRTEEHEKSLNPDQVRDFCDFLLNSVQEDRESWNEVVDTEEEIHNQIHMILANMIAAGSETSASVLSWAVVYLLHWPHLQQVCFYFYCFIFSYIECSWVVSRVYLVHPLILPASVAR